MKEKGATFILIRDNKVLMQLRDEKSALYPHMWTFPGGRCEHNENPLAAAVREAKEEYEVILDPAKATLLMTYDVPYNSNLVEYVYMFQLDSTQEPVLHEGADMQWMSLEKIEDTEIGFGKKEIILPKLKEYQANMAKK